MFRDRILMLNPVSVMALQMVSLYPQLFGVSIVKVRQKVTKLCGVWSQIECLTFADRTILL